MKYRIHVERKDSIMTVEDSFVLEGDTAEDIQAKANDWLRARGLMDADVWSEEL